MPSLPEPIPTWDGLTRLRFEGLPAAVCGQSYLVITTQLELSLANMTLSEAQLALWGIEQREIGRTLIHPIQIVVGKPVLFTVTYQAGEKGLPAGALVRFVVPKAFTHPQSEDATLPGYTRLLEENKGVSLVEIRGAMETHEKVSIICRLEKPLPPGGGFSLQYQTDKTYIYPNTLDRPAMIAWFTNIPPLTASVAISASHPYVGMSREAAHVVEFIPGPSERLHLMLPGRRYASEPLFIHGVYTDRYRNVPPTGLINGDIELHLLAGEESKLLDGPAEHFTDRHRFQVPLPALPPGIYRVRATDRQSGQQLALSNPLQIVPEGAGERLYWGEIHSHTELSDGGGDFNGVFQHARHEGCLDFATVSEHAEYITDNQWGWMQDVINRWNEPGRFVTLIGYEWIGVQRDRIVYTAHDRLPLLRGDEPETENLKDFWGRFDGDEDVVGGSHATMVHQTKWEQHNPRVERFAEIYSMWGSSDFRDSPLVAPWIGPGRGISVNEILQTGAKLGFTGGGDCHDGRVGFTSEDPDGQGTVPHTFAAIILFRCGMTAANMPDLSRKALVGALRQRRTYATTGARILLEFTISGLAMGSEGTAALADCQATIHAVSPLQKVQIIKDGEVAWEQEVSGLDVTVRWIDPQPPTREHYYYLHVIQEDGQRAWASPIWIRPPAE
jgi:hypothetical protein